MSTQQHQVLAGKHAMPTNHDHTYQSDCNENRKSALSRFQSLPHKGVKSEYDNYIWKDKEEVETKRKEQTIRMKLTRAETYRQINNISHKNLGLIANPFHEIFRRKSVEYDATAVTKLLAERLQKIEFKRLTLKQIFKRYVESSTLHGFRYSCSDMFILRRLVWGLLMVLGAIYFIVKLKQGIIEYLSYPFSSIATVESVDSLEFPVVSFCLINSLNISKVKNSTLNVLYKQNRLPIYSNWSDPDFNISGEKLYSLLHNSSFNIDDILESCNWILQQTANPNSAPFICNSSNFTQFINKNGQLCFEFNRPIESVEVLRVDKKGLNYGFDALFNLHSNDALNTLPLAGIQVMVHHYEEPSLQSNEFIASAGYKTFASLTKVEVRIYFKLFQNTFPKPICRIMMFTPH